jgi:hypothetical protein
MIGLLLLAFSVQAPAIPKVIVTIEVPEAVRVVEGEPAEARIVATIKEGFKIQANPAADRFLIPARLQFEPDDRVRVGPPIYPPGKPYRLQGATSELSIYEKTVEIRVPLEATRPAQPADATGTEFVLQGSLRFQACNAVVCLKPSSVPVRVKVRIGPGGDEATPHR